MSLLRMSHDVRALLAASPSGELARRVTAAVRPWPQLRQDEHEAQLTLRARCLAAPMHHAGMDD